MDKESLSIMLDQYMDKYAENYGQDEVEYIRENFIKLYKTERHIDILDQIYQHLGILPYEENIYLRYFEFLKEQYNINGNILEVASGYFPAFAQIIDEHQQRTGKGTITAFDPMLVTSKCGKINLNKKKFDERVPLRDFSLVTSIFPCSTTETIIRASTVQKKDFSILTCNCVHLPELRFEREDIALKKWVDHLYKIAKENLDSSRTIDVDYLNKSFIDTPIIRSRKKAKVKISNIT